jgi:predicted transcriptional regulator
MTRQAEQVEQTRRAAADARVLRAVRAAPGATTYRLRVTCRLNDAGARHALNRLEEAGLVRRDQQPGNSRTGFISHWYAEDIDQRERRRRQEQNTGTLAGSVGQLVPSTGQQQDTVRQLVGKYATGPDDQALLLEALGLQEAI